MSTFIPIVKMNPMDLEERKWLMRVRGTTLAAYADAANQLLLRNGLTMYSKSFTHGFERDPKLDAGGHINQDRTKFTSQTTYRMDINHRHPAAESLGLIITYLAPDDIEDAVDPNAQSVQQSELRIRLLKLSTQGATVVDPVSGSGWAIELKAAAGTLPANRITENQDNIIEGIDPTTGNLELAENDWGPQYSARFLRTMCVTDVGSATTTRPRRLSYDGLSSTDDGVTISIFAQSAVVLNMLAFEIPKLHT